MMRAAVLAAALCAATSGALLAQEVAGPLPARRIADRATDEDPHRRFSRPYNLLLDSISPPPAAPGVKEVIVDGRTGAILDHQSVCGVLNQARLDSAAQLAWAPAAEARDTAARWQWTLDSLREVSDTTQDATQWQLANAIRLAKDSLRAARARVGPADTAAFKAVEQLDVRRYPTLLCRLRLASDAAAPQSDPYVNRLLHVRTATKPLRFNAKDFVRITVVNVNPLLFTYAISVGDSQVVAEANPADFFKLAFGIDIPSVGSGTNAPPAPTVTPKNAVPSPCDDALNALAAQTKRVDSLHGVIDSIFNSVQSHRNDFRSKFLIEWELTRNAFLGAKAVRSHAYVADSLIHNYEPHLRDALELLEQNVPAYEDGIVKLDAQDKTYQTTLTCTDSPAPVVLTNAKRDTALFNSWKSSVEKYSTNIETERAMLDAVWSDQTRYWKAVVLPRHSKANDVIITIARRPIVSTVPDSSAKDTTSKSANADGKSPPKDSTQVATTTTATTTTTTTSSGTSTPSGNASKSGSPPAKKPSGTPPPAGPALATSYDTISQPVLHYDVLGRFSIGAGFVYGALRAPQYGTTARRNAPRPGVSGDTSSNIVTLTDNSGFRVIPAVTLSTLLWNSHWESIDGVHVTIGAGVLPKAGDVSVDYLVALGVGILGSRIMVSPGIYIGRKNYLLPGTRLGDAIAQTTPPIGSRMQAQFGIGVTYQLVY